MRPLMILVAGPYRSGTGDDPVLIERNVAAMTATALQLFRAGHLPLLGEWIALPLIREAGSTRTGDAAFDEIFHPSARRLVARCDACLRIGGASSGADEMVRLAREHGRAVYHRLDEIPGEAAPAGNDASAAMQQLFEPLLPGLMGMRLLTLEPDRVVGEMPVRADLCTAGGILHGGAVMAFADTLGAVGTIVNLRDGRGTTTTDSSTKFIAGAKRGSTVRGESLALHRGRTTMVWETRVSNDAGKLCAVVTQTQLVLEARA